MGPSYIEAKGKNVSNQVFDIRKGNPFVNLAQMNGAYPLTLQEFPNMPIQTFKLIIGNPGPLPKWRGVAGDGWLFIDEIEVYGHD
jgi:hypothetical protein